MQVDVSKNSVLEMPAHFNDVSAVKLYDDEGNLFVVVMRHGAANIVVTADQPDFVSFCKQYGINATKAETIIV